MFEEALGRTGIESSINENAEGRVLYLCKRIDSEAFVHYTDLADEVIVMTFAPDKAKSFKSREFADRFCDDINKVSGRDLFEVFEHKVLTPSANDKNCLYCGGSDFKISVIEKKKALVHFDENGDFQLGLKRLPNVRFEEGDISLNGHELRCNDCHRIFKEISVNDWVSLAEQFN